MTSKTNMSMQIIKCCVILLLGICSHQCLVLNKRCTDSQEVDPIVALPNGQIRGHILTTANDNAYYAFQEIPYASPPIGDLRFKNPVPPTNWHGILNTTKNTKICYQRDARRITRNVVQTEDCLYINVYTPLKPGDVSAAALPVLVWIHGGGFTHGDGTFEAYGPQFFMDYDIIIVAMNYRVGPLGFLTTEDGVIPGNLGLKDQNLALQWIHENIKLFGGDPEKITVSGESSGGGSAGLQLISKKSKGLFRGVILQSGNALFSVYRQKYAKYYAFELGRALDSSFTSNDSVDLLELLQNKSAYDITLTNITIPLGMENRIGDHAGFIWVPVIEDERFPDAFITGPMCEDIKNGNINQVTTLLGFTSEEYVRSTNYEKLQKLALSLDQDLSKLINDNFNMTDENKCIAGRQLREIYTNGKFQDNLGPLVKFMSDISYVNPTVKQAELQSNYADVYLYQFSYQGLMGREKRTIEGVNDLKPGVVHSEDIHYMWTDSINADISRFPVSDILTHKRILKLWFNFVKYLNPTPAKDVLLKNIIWPKVSPNNITYLNIDKTFKVQTDPRQYKKVKEIIDAYAIPPLINY